MFGDIGKMMSMMKNLQGLKDNMEKMKSDLANREYTATSANAQVTAVVSGELVLKRLMISPDFARCGDGELIQNTVIEAVNSAMVSAKLDAASRLSEATGGMNIPGLN